MQAAVVEQKPVYNIVMLQPFGAGLVIVLFRVLEASRKIEAISRLKSWLFGR